MQTQGGPIPEGGRPPGPIESAGSAGARSGAERRGGAIERAPRLGPDGQPLPPRNKRPRKPIGPDANGLGPDGTPWDPERRAKRQAERATQQPSAPDVNSTAPAAVESQTPATSPAETPTE